MHNASLQLADFSEKDKGRFWDRIDKNGPIHPSVGQCWTWTGQRNRNGYGVFYFRRMHLAHRIGWALWAGELSLSLKVLHRCDNPSCVRPAHLFIGTQADNVADMISKGRHRYSFGPAHGAIMSRVAARGIGAGSALSDAQVIEIRSLVSDGGISKREVGRRYGVSHTVIVNITLGRMRKTV